MASYQRLALFVFFDSIERDIVAVIRSIVGEDEVLTDAERKSANTALSRQIASPLDPMSSFDQLLGLDIGTKFQVLMRLRTKLDAASAEYYRKLQPAIERVIVVRNAVMHGRPLTIEEYATGFAFAQDLRSRPSMWPEFHRNYLEYAKSPQHFSSYSVGLLDHPGSFGVLNNLPLPDYDDTGFFPRPEIERSLKKKLLGRHPVITVLGEGGNGKTALSLQTLYGLVESNDHGFDLILWYSAKSAVLSVQGVKEIETAVTASSSIISQAAEFEPGEEDSMTRLRRLLSQSKVLLVIDNLETVTGGLIRDLVEDIPGESKLLLTSRIPVGGDLPVYVNEFSESEALKFLRIVIEAHSVSSLRVLDNAKLKFFAGRLNCKPLLLKWFVLGVKIGLDPNKIVSDPKNALKFCLENVIEKLGEPAKYVSVILTAVSEAISVSVLNEISEKDAFYIEEGIGELTRFGLVTSEDMSGIDRQFKLRSFVRSYIVRVINPDTAYTKQIGLKYRRVNEDYDRERMQAHADKYQMKHMTVRSRSEAIAAKKLRNAVRTSMTQGLIDEDIFEEVKITNPAYFEVYRSEAVAAFYASDIPRAIQSYEAALEYGADQPQLHFFFAGFLMRSGYSERSADEFNFALQLDPGEPAVLREAARNLFQLRRFEEAKILLDKIGTDTARSTKDMVVLIDLQIQARVRLIDHNTTMKVFDKAADGCIDLLQYLKSCDKRLFDTTIYDHIRSVISPLAIIVRDGRFGGDEVDALSVWVQENATYEGWVSASSSQDVQRIGSLKIQGRKPTFGFIVDKDENEFFVAAAKVGKDMWQWLNSGNLVLFDVANNDKGAIAINLTQYNS